jgi:hypothetical protein
MDSKLRCVFDMPADAAQVSHIPARGACGVFMPVLGLACLSHVDLLHFCQGDYNSEVQGHLRLQLDIMTESQSSYKVIASST